MTSKIVDWKIQTNLTVAQQVYYYTILEWKMFKIYWIKIQLPTPFGPIVCWLGLTSVEVQICNPTLYGMRNFFTQYIYQDSKLLVNL